MTHNVKLTVSHHTKIPQLLPMRNKNLFILTILLAFSIQQATCFFQVIAKLASKGLTMGAKAAMEKAKEAAMKKQKEIRKDLKRKANQKLREKKKKLEEKAKSIARKKARNSFPAAKGLKAGISSNASDSLQTQSPTFVMEHEMNKAIEAYAFYDLHVLLRHYQLFKSAGQEESKLRVSLFFLECFVKNKKEFKSSLQKSLNADSVFVEMSFLLMYLSINSEGTKEILNFIFASKVPSGKEQEAPIPYLQRVFRIQSKELHEAFQVYLTQFYERDQVTIANIVIALATCSPYELGIFFQQIFTLPYQKTYRGFLYRLKHLPQLHAIPRDWIKLDLARDFLIDPVHNFTPKCILIPNT